MDPNHPHILITSMHSSSMRTAHLFTVASSIWEEECLPKGGVCPRGFLPRGCLPRVVSLPGECIPACNGGDSPPPVNRMTDRCKNITLPQTSFAGGNNVE